MMRAVSLLLLCVLGLNGCFHYVGASPAEAARQGAQVRVQLSRPVDVPVGPVTVRDVVQVTGETVSAGADSVRISAYALRTQVGYGAVATGETVTVPRTGVFGFQVKRMDPARSGLIAAAIIAAGVLTAGIGGAFSNSGSGHGSGSTQ